MIVPHDARLSSTALVGVGYNLAACSTIMLFLAPRFSRDMAAADGAMVSVPEVSSAGSEDQPMACARRCSCAR